ncbi:hypothetical protein E2C01_070363 [Portunus trituberculatus]|uniref:Uncharacterized protein n=1 Tax=Portunus trituberculatus TaxID=210409 RepID=A0A5B7HX35_PORTR|nr:hypothetical protein [Portunus trituberculatus]
MPSFCFTSSCIMYRTSRPKIGLIQGPLRSSLGYTKTKGSKGVDCSPSRNTSTPPAGTPNAPTGGQLLLPQSWGYLILCSPSLLSACQ